MFPKQYTVGYTMRTPILRLNYNKMIDNYYNYSLNSAPYCASTMDVRVMLTPQSKCCS